MTFKDLSFETEVNILDTETESEVTKQSNTKDKNISFRGTFKKSNFSNKNSHVITEQNSSVFIIQSNMFHEKFRKHTENKENILSPVSKKLGSSKLKQSKSNASVYSINSKHYPSPK